MTMKKYYLSPHFFLKFHEDKLILWGYKNHRQFILNDEYLKRIIEISRGNEIKASDIDGKLLKLNIISDEPYPSSAWKWDALSQIYHLGVQDLSAPDTKSQEEWILNYINFCDSLDVSTEQLFVHLDGKKLPLPDPKPQEYLSSSLWECFKKRKTSRNFDGTPIPSQTLSSVLYATFGLIHGNWDEEEDSSFLKTGCRKSFPSGGALHPIEAYPIIMNVSDLEKGIYHYRSDSHELVRRGEVMSSEDLIELLGGQFFAKGIAVGVFLVGHFNKVWCKYRHSRSYRDVFLEAGHASQNLLLAATSANLKTWMTAWFNDTKVSNILNLDSEIEAPIVFLGIGNGAAASIPQEMELMLKE